MLNITKLKLLLVIVVAVTMNACGTMQAYEGPKRSPEEIALIKSNHLQGFFETAYVGEIDGKDLSSVEDNAEVLPGEHTVKIYVTRGLGMQQFISSKSVTLNAKAGHIYQVNGAISDGAPYAWIIDESNGYIVSGEKP